MAPKPPPTRPGPRNPSQTFEEDFVDTCYVNLAASVGNEQTSTFGPAVGLVDEEGKCVLPALALLRPLCLAKPLALLNPLPC